MIVPPSARDLVLSLRDLPSPPTVYLTLTDLVSSADWSARDVADVVGADPAVAARVLRLANSPFYGVPRTVASIHDAVTLLGAGEVRALVLATTVLERFEGVPDDVASVDLMRRRAVYCALTTVRLGSLSGVTGRDCEWFLTGLVFDLGSLVVCVQMPEAVREAVNMGEAPSEDGGPSVECAITGSDEALVGAELLTQWRLPTAVAEAVRWSRTPRQALHSRRQSALLHIASRISAPLARGAQVMPSQLSVDESVWSQCGLRAETVDGIPDRVAEDYSEVAGWLTAPG